MKNYFCVYINHTQDNWVNNLLKIEFAANNYVNAATKVTLFFANYIFHPQTSIEPLGIYKGEQKTKLLAANKTVKKQSKIMTFLQNLLV